MVVYVDVLVGLNLFVNCFLLSAVSRMVRFPLKNGRKILSGLVLAFGSLVILLPPMTWWQGLAFRLIWACLGVVLAFGFCGVAAFFRLLAALFGAVLVFGGVMTALFQLFAPAGLLVYNGAVYYDISPFLLVVSTLVSYLVLYFLRKNFTKESAVPMEVQLNLQQNQITCTVQAKLDTGFALTDLYGDHPVVLVSPSVANQLFAPHETAYRFIPYETVGETGMLASGVCKRVLAQYGARKASFQNVVIAVAKRELQAPYKALVGMDFLERLEWDAQSSETIMEKTVAWPKNQAHRLHRRHNCFAATLGQTKRTGTDGTPSSGGFIGTRNSHHP